MGIPLVDAKARFLKPAKFNDLADIASEVSEFRRSSFEVQPSHLDRRRARRRRRETRVWAAQDPADPTKLKGMPIPATARGHARFKAA